MIKRNQQNLADHMSIFESELCVIAGLAAAWARHELETGGIGLGLWTHGGRPVVFLATDAGPKAIRQYAYCQHDIDFFHVIVKLIEETFGIQWLGDWHSHHFMGIDHPSGGDLQQIQAIAKKKGVQRWAGIIATTTHNDDTHLNTKNNPTLNLFGQSSRVRINAFLYDDPQAAQERRIPIKIIPGISPVRMALLAGDKIAPKAIGEQFRGFPLELIDYDRFDPSASSDNSSDQVPEAIVSQLRQLPSEAMDENIDLYVEDNLVIVKLPLYEGATVDIAIDQRSPHRIRGVYVKITPDNEAQDVTDKLFQEGHDIGLVEAYKMLLAELCEKPKRNLARGPRNVIERIRLFGSEK
jgi:hypothetical protein